MRIGILNATGYAGGELVRYLAGHPEFEISGVTARSQAGRRLHEVFPWLRASGRAAYADLELTAELNGSADLVISCLPHKASAAQLASFLDDGVRCIDVSSDFRLRDPADYMHWHGVEHAASGVDQFGRLRADGMAPRADSPDRPGGQPGLSRDYGCAGAGAGGARRIGDRPRDGRLQDGCVWAQGARRHAAYGFSEINEDAAAYRRG